MKLLFTCVGRRVELVQAFHSAARRLGVGLELHGADGDCTAPALRFCDKAHIVPRVVTDEYIPALVELCKAEGVDALVPTIDTDLLVLAENKQAFAEAGTTVVVSAPDKVALCRDKRLTADLFDSAGLEHPATFDDWRQYDAGYPAFIKPKDGSSSINAFKVGDAAELGELAARIPDYIVQPFVEGEEYTVDVMCDLEGSPVYVTPRIRLATRTGEVLKTEIAQDERIISEALRLVEAFEPCGPLAVQLIREASTDADYFIEVNPRFGGGAPLSMKAGADGAEALLRALAGESLPYQPCAAEDGAVYSRFDQSVRIK